MTDLDEQFEARLSKLRPIAPSANLDERIAEQVQQEIDGDKTQRPSGRVVWSIGLGIAALVMIGVTVWLTTRPHTPAESTVTPPMHADAAVPPKHLVVPPASDSIDPLPTVGNYLRALRESPERFDVLLQKHAASLMPPTPGTSLAQLKKDNSL